MNRSNEVVAAGPVTRRESTALRRWVTWAGVVLILLIVGADSYEAWQDYRRVVRDNEHIEVALGRAVTEQTERMLEEVDRGLAACAAWITSAQGAGADETALVAHLHAEIASLPFVSSAALIGTDGALRASTRLVPGSVPDSPRTFAVSRRIDADGEFRGVVVARIAVDYLTLFYAGIHLTPDTSIRLSREDGTTLVAFPTGDAADGHQRIEVLRKVDGYPVVVEVSRSLRSVLQPWIQEERSSAARTLTLAVLATLLLMALRAALERQEHMDLERNRLEKELAAIQRVEALGFLAASVAHDFNNVLTAIIGYAELTRETVQADPAPLANVDRLLAATERARLLVRQVLTFDSRRSLSYAPTALVPILEEVAQQLRATLPSSLALCVDGWEDAVHVQGDATEIYQVVMNLCSNAVHAMPMGGTLVIRLTTLAAVEPRELALGRLDRGRWACLSISDSGVGLPSQQVAAIFEPFYTTRQPNQGTGIGLTVVRNIILRMNGALDVKSQLGQGTQMAVYWPCVATPAVLPGLASLQGGTGQTVMVVDDDKELVAITEELLATLGYEPVGFSDARAALEAFRRDPGRFEAILTDDRMLPLRGLEFARLIREVDPYLPIVLMTAHRDAESDRLAGEIDIAQILEKPLRVQTLREALAKRFHTAQ